MRTELPVCKRCCFCVPLRYGLITWGYFKLIIGTLVSIWLSVTLYNVVDQVIQYGHTFYANDIAMISTLLVVVLTDMALTTLFLVGGHTENLKLLRVYYIYNIVMLCLTIALVLGSVVMFLVVMVPGPHYSSIWMELFDTLFSMSGLYVNILICFYFMLLLHSEIIKLRNNCEFKFVNNTAEAECVMKYKEVMVDEEKGTKNIGEEGPIGAENEYGKMHLPDRTCHKNEDQN